MADRVKRTWARSADCRRKWFTISVRYRGREKPEEVAKFTHEGDVYPYTLRLAGAPETEEIIIT